MYSHTIFPAEVTSNTLPLSDSVINVFPFGKRWFVPHVLEKKACCLPPRYCQTISFVKGSNSSTLEYLLFLGAVQLLSKISIFPLSSKTGSCMPDHKSFTEPSSAQTTFSLSKSTIAMVFKYRAEISAFPFLKSGEISDKWPSDSCRV